MFEEAFNFMMDNEDYARQYKTVSDAPIGAHAISGINSAAYPKQFALINAIPQIQRGEAVKNFYRTEFWNSWMDKINSIDLVKRVFDAAVNMGPNMAVILLQKAINSVNPNTVAIDGAWGQKTVENANKDNFVDEFKAVRIQHYKDIVAKKPSNKQYLSAWIARAQK
jgi:lysozyme family protein